MIETTTDVDRADTGRIDPRSGLPVDLRRYPIDAPLEDGYRALLTRCRAAMAADGACVLDGFVSPAGIEGILHEIGPHLGSAFYKSKTHNPYLLADDPAHPPDHPRNRRIDTTSATLGYDFVPKGGTLDRLYRWPALQGFIADVLGLEALHPNCDPLSPVNVLVYERGTTTGWHFDNARFVVTLMLQPAASGGAYEYAPFIRSAEDERYDRVARVLDGTSRDVKILRQPPGALVVFAGHRTLHRVTPVGGDRLRLVAVFTYSTEPGYELDPHTRCIFYGKVG